MSAGPGGIAVVVVVLLVVFTVPVVGGAILFAPGVAVALDACTMAIGFADSGLVPLLDALTAAEETADILGNADVFAAFQTVSHRILRNPAERNYDVLIGGPDDRKGQIIELVRSMNLRPVNAGPLAVAPHLERMTLLLLSINKANRVKESGIQITGV